MEMLFTWSSFIRALDILIVAYIIYILLKWSKDTQVMNLAKGIILVVFFKIVSDYFTLYTISWLLDQVITWGVVVIVVLFQPELRLYLTQLGTNNFFMKKKSPISKHEQFIEEISKAAQYLSKRNIGALMSIERANSLKSYVNTGVSLNAVVSNQLLINIFIPNTPLHDGAIIIQGDKIAAASCVLPLSENPNIPQELGTRHRAALGMSEQTDAIIVVISEETGDISIAHKGELNRYLTPQQFETLLRVELADNTTNDKQQRFATVKKILDSMQKKGR